MHHVLCLTPLGQSVGAPIPLDRRRRRLSTVVARHNTAGPRVLAFKVPAGHALDMEKHVIPRSRWKDTLVGANDNVVIMALVAGGGGGQGGAGKAMSIGLAVAAIALVVIGAWYVLPALQGALGAAAGSAAWSGVTPGVQLGVNHDRN